MGTFKELFEQRIKARIFWSLTILKLVKHLTKADFPSHGAFKLWSNQGPSLLNSKLWNLIPLPRRCSGFRGWRRLGRGWFYSKVPPILSWRNPGQSRSCSWPATLSACFAILLWSSTPWPAPSSIRCPISSESPDASSWCTSSTSSSGSSPSSSRWPSQCWGTCSSSGTCGSGRSATTGASTPLIDQPLVEVFKTGARFYLGQETWSVPHYSTKFTPSIYEGTFLASPAVERAQRGSTHLLVSWDTT